MIPYLKSVFMDEGAFLGFLRAVLMAVGLGIESGQFPLPAGIPPWLGLVACGAAMMMRSSVKAPPKTPPKAQQ